MQAGMERDFEDMRRKGLQQDLFKGKLRPDDVKKMGYTDDQVREIISGKKLLLGESWGDFSGGGLPKIKILGKGELSDDEVNRMRRSERSGAKPRSRPRNPRIQKSDSVSGFTSRPFVFNKTPTKTGQRV
jgi:hypothetical protein